MSAEGTDKAPAVEEQPVRHPWFNAFMQHPLARTAFVLAMLGSGGGIYETTADTKTLIAAQTAAIEVQGKAIDAIKDDLASYKSTTSAEDVRLNTRIDGLAVALGARIDGVELRVKLQDTEIDRRLAQWDQYWTEFQPAVRRWLERQDSRDRAAN